MAGVCWAHCGCCHADAPARWCRVVLHYFFFGSPLFTVVVAVLPFFLFFLFGVGMDGSRVWSSLLDLSHPGPAQGKEMQWHTEGIHRHQVRKRGRENTCVDTEIFGQQDFAAQQISVGLKTAWSSWCVCRASLLSAQQPVDLTPVHFRLLFHAPQHGALHARCLLPFLLRLAPALEKLLSADL